MTNTQKSFWLMVLAGLAGAWIAVSIKELAAVYSSIVIFCLMRIFTLIGRLPHIRRNWKVLCKPRHPWLLLWMAVLYAVAFIVYFQAITLIPMSIASLFMNSAPLYIPLIAYFVLSDRSVFLLSFWAGLIVSFIGVVLILSPAGSNHYHPLSMLLSFSSGVILAASQVVAKKILYSDGTEHVVYAQMSVGVLISLFPAGWLFYVKGQMYIDPLLDFRVLFFLITAAICSWFYQSFRAKAVKLTSVSIAMPFGYLGVVFIGVADMLIWHVIPDWLSIFGMLLVISGVVFIVRKA